MLSSKLANTFVIAAIAVLMFGCATAPAPVPEVKKVTGRVIDIAELSGSWLGQYNSTVTKRSGVISLDLNESSGKAIGQVILTSKTPIKVSSSPKSITSPGTVKRTQEKSLSIEFIAVQDGKVSGDVTPYTDPAFGEATVFTTFEGTLTGNRLEGTYTSRIGQDGHSYNGSWWAVRQ